MTTALSRRHLLAAALAAEDPVAPGSPVEEFWQKLHGRRLNLQADGAAHLSYCDHPTLLTQIAAITGMSEEDLQGWIGTLDDRTATRIQQAYPLAFFDLHLRHRRRPLLDGPNDAFPDVRYYR